LVLFDSKALASGDSSILISSLNLTRKQYNSRISDLTNAGLVRRTNGKYFLTSFGKLVYEAIELMGRAVQHLSKIKAIDSIESRGFPASELSKLIDTLINNSQIKEILVSSQYNFGAEKKMGFDNELIDSASTIRSGAHPIHETSQDRVELLCTDYFVLTTCGANVAIQNFCYF
jgi:hypothetical protein